MVSPIKVLMVGPSREERGGITAVVNGYYTGGLDNRCNLTYLASTGRGNRLRKAIIGVGALAWLTQNVHKYDLVHVHLGGGNSFYREQYFINIAAKAGVPTILHVHDGLFKQNFEEKASPLLRGQIRRVFERANCIVTLSSRDKEYILSKIAHGKNVVFIPNGIQLPKTVVLPKTPQTVLFLGHFDDNKNADVLIKAMATVAKSFPNSKCYFCADGDVSSFSALAESLNVKDVCVFLGWVDADKKQELLDRCSIYCLPSKNEAMPMSLLEAMANGLVALVTPVGGMVDIVDDWKTGKFVPIGDVNNLANAIMMLFEDSDMAAKLAFSGKAAVEKNYSIDTSINRLIDLYAAVANSGKVIE